MWITRVSINNPVFATMMMAALLVLGLFSYQRLNVDQFPDVSFPIVVVQTEYPGASPETVESDVTRKIEEAGVFRRGKPTAGLAARCGQIQENPLRLSVRILPGDRTECLEAN